MPEPLKLVSTEGTMWRLCVMVVMLSPWQVSSAPDLVNLVEPQVTLWAPVKQFHMRGRQIVKHHWKLFDGDKTTGVEVKPARYHGYFRAHNPRLDLSDAYAITPTHYRITLPADLDPADAPREWVLCQWESYEKDAVCKTRVTNAVFQNGVYEGALFQPVRMRRVYFELEYPWTSTRIAEIELLGPREDLNALWPHGDYPCDQRLAVLNPTTGPDNVWAKTKIKIKKTDLFPVFIASEKDRPKGIDVRFDNAESFLFGAELPEGPMVQEVMVNSYYTRRPGLLKVVLQANFCEPRCDRFGSRGWVRLAVGKPKSDAPEGIRIHIENPAKYKAYRLKFVPQPDDEGTLVDIQNIFFLGCKASTA